MHLNDDKATEGDTEGTAEEVKAPSYYVYVNSQ